MSTSAGRACSCNHRMIWSFLLQQCLTEGGPRHARFLYSTTQRVFHLIYMFCFWGFCRVSITRPARAQEYPGKESKICPILPHLTPREDHPQSQSQIHPRCDPRKKKTPNRHRGIPWPPLLIHRLNIPTPCPKLTANYDYHNDNTDPGRARAFFLGPRRPHPLDDARPEKTTTAPRRQGQRSERGSGQ